MEQKLEQMLKLDVLAQQLTRQEVFYTPMPHMMHPQMQFSGGALIVNHELQGMHGHDLYKFDRYGNMYGHTTVKLGGYGCHIDVSLPMLNPMPLPPRFFNDKKF